MIGHTNSTQYQQAIGPRTEPCGTPTISHHCNTLVIHSEREADF